jgi:E3 ubiquitin-protein ligase RNF14
MVFRHGPITSCPIAYSEKLVLEYLGLPDGSAGRQFIETRFGKLNVLKLVATYQEEQANKEWLESSTMACPGCQVHVEKSLGCNHVGLRLVCFLGWIQAESNL